jgi:hypothetical protein
VRLRRGGTVNSVELVNRVDMVKRVGTVKRAQLQPAASARDVLANHR